MSWQQPLCLSHSGFRSQRLSIVHVILLTWYLTSFLLPFLSSSPSNAFSASPRGNITLSLGRIVTSHFYGVEHGPIKWIHPQAHHTILWVNWHRSLNYRNQFLAAYIFFLEVSNPWKKCHILKNDNVNGCTHELLQMSMGAKFEFYETWMVTLVHKLLYWWNWAPIIK